MVAIGVTAVLGLLPALARQGADDADVQTALRLTDAIQLALAQRATAGFGALADAIPEMSADLESGLKLVARRDGTVVRWLDPDEAPFQDQYFLIVVRRFSTGPLAYVPPSACLAVNARISWPYRPLTPAGRPPPSPGVGRQAVSLNLAVNR